MTGIEPLVAKGGAKAAAAIPKAIPPAIRAVRRLLDDRNNRQAMTRILTSAMISVAQDASPSAGVGVDKIEEVARGAVAVASTGSVRQVNGIVRILRRARKPLSGDRTRRIKDVPALGAAGEITKWVQVSAAANEVTFFANERHARKVADLFIDKALVNPNLDDKGFSGRLSEAWKISVKEATESAALADIILYSGQSVAIGAMGAAAATAAGEFANLSGSQVIAFAAACGAGFAVLAGGIAAEHRRRASQADYGLLLNLRKEVYDFLFDAAIAIREGALHPRPEKSDYAPSSTSTNGSPNRFEALRDDLDARLLPAAYERAPNLAVYLEQVSHQFRLLAQDRPAYDPYALGIAMEAAWQLLQPADGDSSPPLRLAVLKPGAPQLQSPEVRKARLE
jgi:hypothetical protein